MKNEGILYEGLEQWDRDARIRQFKGEFKTGNVNARTNRGIRIGMNESQVRQILGRPRRTIWSKKFQSRELIYRREVKWPKSKQEPDGTGTGMSWTNYYLFRNGRLFYIELAQNLEGGA